MDKWKSESEANLLVLAAELQQKGVLAVFFKEVTAELYDVLVSCRVCTCYIVNGWLGSRVVSVLDSGAVRPGFKSQP